MDEEQKKAMEESVANAIEDQMPKMLEAVEEASKENAEKAAEATKNQGVATGKSVMRSLEKDGELAVKAPFVTLGTETEKFVKSFVERAQGIVKTGEQNEGDDASGGYLVAPAEVEASILQYQFQNSIIRKYARVRRARGNTYEIKSLDQSVNSYGGVVMSWKNESEQLSRTGLKFEKKELTLGKLTGLNGITNELLQDSLVNVANYIIQVFGAATTYMEDMAFINGDGVKNSPIGVLQTPDIIAVNRLVADEIGYKDVNSMYHKMRTGERAKGVFIGSATAVEYLDGQLDVNGRPLLSVNPANTMEMRLKARPLIECDENYLPALGVKGDLIFVNWDLYYIIDKLGLRIDASIHNRFEYDEIDTRFIKRITGEMASPRGVVVLDVPSA